MVNLTRDRDQVARINPYTTTSTEKLRKGHRNLKVPAEAIPPLNCVSISFK